MKKHVLNKRAVSIGAFVIGASIVFALFSFSRSTVPPETAEAQPIVDNQAESFYRTIDGAVSTEDYHAATVAVMIENHPDARPQAGLADAPLVIEAPVEGTITRFIAFFDVDDEFTLDAIGPVRSVRPYYLDWALGYDAVLMHVGGAPAALERIRNGEVNSVDEFFNARYYRRSDDRSAPHNVYTDSSRIMNMLDDRDIPASEYDSWKYKDDMPVGDPVVSIAYDAYLPDFDVEYLYDGERNRYVRYQADRKHVDADGTVITPRNIIFIETDVDVIDNVGRRKIKTLGEGSMIVARDGEVIEGTWFKDDLKSRMRFYDADGNEVEFNRGASWIHVVPSFAALTWE